jgi:hypothetical protein
MVAVVAGGYAFPDPGGLLMMTETVPYAACARLPLVKGWLTA